jgi:hypothetical protein
MEDTAPLWAPLLSMEEALLMRACSRTISSAVEAIASRWHTLSVKVSAIVGHCPQSVAGTR